MSIDNGWNRADKAAEDDYEDDIARADAIGKLAAEYEKKLLAGESIFVDGVNWIAGEVFDEAEICSDNLFVAIMKKDCIEIACVAEKLSEFITGLAEEHIDNMEPGYD